MKFQFYKCTDNYVLKNQDRIVEIATLAFRSIPREEVVERFSKYDDILLIIDENQEIQGFNFLSEHRNGKTLLVGGRLVAIDPKLKGKGLLRTASVRLFIRYYIKLLKESVLGQTNQLFLFSRQCNPIAYCLLNIGQEIYPDLINKTKVQNTMSISALDQFKFLKKELQLDNLDVHTGIVQMGAVNAGINSATKGFFADWKTPWSEYVPEGSELITIFPITPLFPLKYFPSFGRRVIKSINF